MRLVLVAVVLVSCGGHPPRTSDVRPPDDTVRPSDVTEAPPEFRILPLNPSGFMWPLTTPPSLEPHYGVGFTWPLVCGRRPVLPDDVVRYVDAWCRHLRSPQFDFVGALTRVLSSNIPGLRAAIVLDLANSGADDFGVESWSGEVAVTRIAVQLELGELDDATATAKRYVLTRSSDRTCGQDLLSWVFVLDPRDIDSLPGRVRRHGTTACGKQFRRLACIIWSAHSSPNRMPECAGVAFDDTDRAITRAVAARLRWSPRLTAGEYLEVAKLASSALLIYDAEGLAIRALERTLQVSCKRLDEVREIAALIDGDHRKQERFAEARAALIAMTESQCLEYQAGQTGK